MTSRRTYCICFLTSEKHAAFLEPASPTSPTSIPKTLSQPSAGPCKISSMQTKLLLVAETRSQTPNTLVASQPPICCTVMRALMPTNSPATYIAVRWLTRTLLMRVSKYDTSKWPLRCPPPILPISPLKPYNPKS